MEIYTYWLTYWLKGADNRKQPYRLPLKEKHFVSSLKYSYQSRVVDV